MLLDRKRPDPPFSRVPKNKDMTSSAAALQGGQHLPCSEKLNTPHRNCRLIFGGSSLCWKGVQLRLAAIPHPTCPNLHLLCIRAAQSSNRWIWFGAQWLPRGAFPLKEPPPTLMESQGHGADEAEVGVPLWATIHRPTECELGGQEAHAQGFWSRIF